MEEPKELLNTIDMDRLAERLGMNTSRATDGFEVIAPIMAKAFLVNRRGIVGAAASIACGVSGKPVQSGTTSAW